MMADTIIADAESKTAVANIVTALEDAWNRHDAEAWAAEFQPDASFTNVFGIEIVGRAGILRSHAHIFATMFRDSRAFFDVPRIRFLREDVASIAAPWRMSGAYDVHGRPWPDRRGLLTFVVTAESGRWKIAVGTNMDLPPEEIISEMQNEIAKARQHGTGTASGPNQQ